MKYRLLTVLMAMLVILQMFSCGIAYAETNDSADSTVVKFLETLGIMGIDSKTGYFWDETPVKRAEIAEILCKMFRFEAVEDKTARFVDVQGSERAYIETIVRYGYMSGYTNNMFGPEDYITNEQLVKIFVCVIGAGNVAEINGGYPNGYIYVANILGLTRNSSASMTADARRIDVANMIYAAMNADMMAIKTIKNDADRNVLDKIYETVEGVNFLNKHLNIYHMRGIVKKIDTTSLNRGDDGVGIGYVQIGKTVYRDPKQLSDEYLGCEVNYFVQRLDENDDGEIIFIEESVTNKIVTVENAETEIIGVNGTTVNYYDGDKQRRLELYSIADMIYNGKAINRDFFKIGNIQDGTVKFIDSNGDGKYEVVIITEYTTGVVSSANSDMKHLYFKFDKAPIALEDTIYKVFRDGEKAAFEDISAGDVVLVAVSSNTSGEKAVRIEATSASVVGTIESVCVEDGIKYLKIDGEEYPVNDYCEALATQDKINEITVGLSGQFFYFDAKGRIAYLSGSATEEKVAFLVALKAKMGILDGEFAVKLYTQDGKFEVLKAREKLKINGETRKVADIVNDAALVSEIQNDIVRKHLVLYKETDGILKEFTYAAADGVYDLQEFSCDEYGSFICYRNSVFNGKYYGDNNTIVFRTPPLGTVEDDPARYLIEKANVFTAKTTSYTLKLYDIQTDGYIKYILSPTNVNFETLDTSPFMLVTNILDGIDEEGESTKIIEGLNNSGNDVSVETSSYTVDFSQLNEGDVIQYKVDAFGDIRTIYYLHNSENTAYYKLMAEHSVRSLSRLGTVFGNVISVNTANLHVKCDELTDGMTPVDTDMIVGSNCSAIYAYYAERGIFKKIEFGDIVREDKIFACVNFDNQTRMIVVYR